MKVVKKRYVYLVLSIFLILCTILLCSKNTDNKTLDEVRLSDEENKLPKDLFAIMISDEDGNYSESTSNTFPSDGYAFNNELSNCIDTSGKIVDDILSFDSTNYTVTVSTDTTVYCYLYFDMINDDLNINIKVNGTNATVPTTGIYKNTVTCTSGNALFNTKYQRFEIGDLESRTDCTLDFTSDTTSYQKLSNVVINNTKNNGDVNVINKNSYMSLTKSEYGSTSQHSGNSFSSTIVSTISNAYSYDDSKNIWIGEVTSTSGYYILKIPVTKTGYYQLCYNIAGGGDSTGSALYIYKNTTTINSVNVFYSDTKSGCMYIGLLNGGSDYILVNSNRHGNVSFYLEMSNTIENISTGYRYSGANPNNYVWFNNELWRIIGLIPACTNATDGICSERTNLVKIIRNISIGRLAYDGKSSDETGKWGNNTLYTLLNNYYYGQQNGIGTAYCYGYKNISIANCDYTMNGIDSEGYYGKMVNDVYWSNGAGTNLVTPSVIYESENTELTVDMAKISIMSASDYGYASDLTDYSVTLNNYHTSGAAATNWLYSQEQEWTNVQNNATSSNVLSITLYGVIGTAGTFTPYAHYGYDVRPVLYLNENVYKISGTGTESDPYIIGK